MQLDPYSGELFWIEQNGLNGDAKMFKLVVISYTGTTHYSVDLVADGLPDEFMNEIAHSVDRIVKIGGAYYLEVQNQIYQLEIGKKAITATPVDIKESGVKIWLKHDYITVTMTV